MEIKDIKKGQHVVYGTNGICLVEDISEMAFPTGGERKLYFILRPTAESGSVIYIPHDNAALLSRLRPTLTKKQADAILDNPLIAETDWIEDRKQRALAFRETVQQNNPHALLPLVKCICRKRDELTEQNKKLSNADREILSSALKAVCGELSFTLGLSHDEIVEKLQNHLKVAL